MYDEKFQPHPDPEIREFEEALLRSIDQAKRGEFGRVHTPEMIAGYKARAAGRPVGSVKANPKVSTTIRLDPDVLDAAKATGKGWQTRVNAVMRREFLGA
ncbi:MAG: BrnA antitoxin family protein [Rhodoferax sp.]|nr:BrnA antitoxin family protein [Rhodoferax sp.]